FPSGVFIIGVNKTKGSGLVRWPGDSKKTVFTLSYYGRTLLKDDVGKTHEVWIYEATDANGNLVYIALAVKPISPHKNLYRLFYTFEKPMAGVVLGEFGEFAHRL